MSKRAPQARRWLLIAALLSVFTTVAAAQPGVAKTTKRKARKKAAAKPAKKTTKKSPATTKKVTGITIAPGSAGGSGKDIDPKGIVRYGTSLDQLQGVHFDPTLSPTVTDLRWIQAVFGTLARETISGTYTPWMAKSLDIVDPSTVRIGLRPGIRFTDGSAFDAKAVRDGLMRTRFQPGSAAVQAGMHSAFRALKTAEVVDPLTVVARLTTPIAGEFIAALANREGAIVSPKQGSPNAPGDGKIDNDPVGAGPFTFERYEKLQVLALRRNADFWDAANWRLGGIDFVHTPVGPAGVNGLLSGAIDWLENMSADSVAKVEADNRYGTASGFTDYGYVFFNLCSGKAPFDDQLVRQAVQMGIDREEFNKLVYNGRGKTATDLWPEGHANFNSATKSIVKYDPTKAKQLLTQAGVKELTVDLYYPSILDYARATEVLQAQLSKLGITLKITASRDVVSEFIQPQKAGILFIPGSRTGYDKYGRVFLTGGQQTLCGMPRGSVMTGAAEAASFKPDDPRSSAAYQRIDAMIAENAWVVPIVYAPGFSGWQRDRIGGTPLFGGSRGIAGLMFDSIYVRK